MDTNSEKRGRNVKLVLMGNNSRSGKLVMLTDNSEKKSRNVKLVVLMALLYAVLGFLVVSR